MKYDASEYTLSTGKTFYAHGGILGLNDHEPTLYEGYDGTVREANAPQEWMDAEENGEKFTPAERREIADYMIALWSEWATPASEQPRAAAPEQLSDEAREARKPPPPESLVGALQDVVHAESGHLRAAKSVRTPNAAPEQLSEKEKGA